MRTMIRWGAAATAAVLAVAGLATSAVADTGDVGYEDTAYAGGNGGPSADKPESKLWFNDGHWFAVMYNNAAADVHAAIPAGTPNQYSIWRLEDDHATWTNTGVKVDDRAIRADVLSIGGTAYIATHLVPTGSPANVAFHDQVGESRLYAFTYDSANKRYVAPASYTVINNRKLESLVLDRDSTGQLWATWVEGDDDDADASTPDVFRVYVNRSTTSATTWGTPLAV